MSLNTRLFHLLIIADSNDIASHVLHSLKSYDLMHAITITTATIIIFSFFTLLYANKRVHYYHYTEWSKNVKPRHFR